MGKGRDRKELANCYADRVNSLNAIQVCVSCVEGGSEEGEML